MQTVTKCPICNRKLGKATDNHHLIPKTFGGKDKITIHKICHSKIHSMFTERELQHHYHTIERLLLHEEMQKFVKWVKKKDPEFYDHSEDTHQRKSKRRR